MPNPQLFVSYAGEDVELAKQISEALRSVGIDAWFAEWEIGPGNDIVERINDGLRRSEFFVLLMSEHSLKKAWPIKEQGVATIRMIEDETRVIPVNLGVKATDLPPLLRTLKWIRADTPDPVAIASQIKAVVFGVSTKPDLGPLPRFLDSLNLSSFPSLTPADVTTLRLTFELGIDTLFRAPFDELEARAASEGIDRRTLEDSLELLQQEMLLKIDRTIGEIMSVKLSTSAAEDCCAQLVPEYRRRKREVLAAVVNGPDPRGTNSDEVTERTGEERWMVCHVLREAAQYGHLDVHPVHVGHDYLSIDSVSPRLKRKLELPVDE